MLLLWHAARLVRRWCAAAAVRREVRTMQRRGGAAHAALRVWRGARALAAWWRWSERRVAAQGRGAEAATWRRAWRLGRAVAGWRERLVAGRVGLLMAHRLADATAKRRGLARWQHDAATRARTTVAAADVRARWARRGLRARLNAWRQLTQQVRGLNRVHQRLTLRLAGAHLCAWRALTRRRGAVRANGIARQAALQSTWRGTVFRVWRGATAARRAARALALWHLEAMVVACLRAWQLAVQIGRRDRRQALRAQAALEQRLKADPQRHAAAHRAAVRWLLLGGGAAFNAWVAYVRGRVWRRGATATADALCARGLAARAFVGWRQAVWYQQLMREARRSLEPAPMVDPASLL